MRKYMQATMLVVSVFLNIWGLLTLLNVIKVLDLGAFAYLDKLRLLLQYVVVVVNMSAGILLFSAWANTLSGKAKNTWLITNCTYSTILTIPLAYTFIGCFFYMAGINLPMVADIALELMDIFKSNGVRYLIYSLGTLMGIVFLAVPIMSTVINVKKNKRLMNA